MTSLLRRFAAIASLLATRPVRLGRCRLADFAGTPAILLLVPAVLAAGCIGVERKSTTSPSSLRSLAGVWSSESIIPSPESCANFQWRVTEQTANSLTGTFSATCAGGLTLSGTAHGTLTTATTITWSASGVASAPGLPSCGFTLSGTAQLEGDRITVPYTGNTCLGPVSGTEVLRRR
ncbi:MAG TPA: hypothetical protein VNI83_01815 [Vicinamibacterales bacterium]|nr:hypothetical protein [Vicinamibacterales bacterium]